MTPPQVVTDRGALVTGFCRPPSGRPLGRGPLVRELFRRIATGQCRTTVTCCKHGSLEARINARLRVTPAP